MGFIDLRGSIATIKEATGARGRVAWMGWVISLTTIGIGVLPPGTWGLTLIGACELAAMVAYTVHRIRVRRRWKRLGQHDAVRMGH